MQSRRRDRGVDRLNTDSGHVDVQRRGSWDVTRPQGRGWRPAIPWWWWRKRDDNGGSPRGTLIFKLGAFSRRQRVALDDEVSLLCDL
jgi:hypothetical protein